MIEAYFRQIEALITSSGIITSSTITYDKRSSYVGFIRGSTYFLDGSELHFREFVNIQRHVERYMYVYHYQRADGTLIFRYDNTRHFPDLPNFPHHKHEEDETSVVPTTEPDLQTILKEIRGIIVT